MNKDDESSVDDNELDGLFGDDDSEANGKKKTSLTEVNID